MELRNRATAIELERNATKFGPAALSRSRSAQSLKLLGDTATQVCQNKLQFFPSTYRIIYLNETQLNRTFVKVIFKFCVKLSDLSQRVELNLFCLFRTIK